MNPLQATSGVSVDAFVVKLGRLLTPHEQIEVLIDEVESFVTSSILSGTQGHSLIVKLQAAIDQLDKGHSNAGIRKLNDFITRINALINSNKILPEPVEPLIAAANEIISRLGG